MSNESVEKADGDDLLESKENFPSLSLTTLDGSGRQEDDKHLDVPKQVSLSSHASHHLASERSIYSNMNALRVSDSNRDRASPLRCLNATANKSDRLYSPKIALLENYDWPADKDPARETTVDSKSSKESSNAVNNLPEAFDSTVSLGSFCIQMSI